jgi:hypothetical protein
MHRLAPALALLACAPQPLDPTGIQTEETFRSELVDDDYLLRLRLPPDHDPDLAYPLIVQLDPTYAGLKQFAHTVGLVSQHEADGDWPAAVVLGVDYPDPWTRHRDYTPVDPPDPDFNDEGADTFYAVLRDEILPHLQTQLTVDPDQRVIVGHSNGGIFAFYTALRYDPAEDPLFTGVVAADFGMDAPMFTYEGWLAERTTDLPLTIYASRAVFNGAPQQITHEALFGRLRDRAYPSLDLQTEVLETDHGGAVVPSFEHGLDHILGGE